ncbi:MAG: hypothetical protein E6R03_04065 [Hyphomicrobiaceae bacterium]|nr:MAG: hypothetical protein E6R03_04065 [Hyphomicrobiaceae bacterium]
MTEEKKTKLMIIGDGTPQGTVVTTEDGRIIDGVKYVTFGHTAGEEPWCEITFVPSKVDVECETMNGVATVNIDHVTEVFEAVDVTDRNRYIEWKREGEK